MGEETRHRDYCQHKDEICVLVIFDLPQGVRSQATEAKQDQRYEDDDLNKLHYESGYRKAALVNRDADGKDNQRKRVREHRCTERDRDGLEPGQVDRLLNATFWSRAGDFGDTGVAVQDRPQAR